MFRVISQLCAVHNNNVALVHRMRALEGRNLRVRCVPDDCHLRAVRQ